ncbi:MAG: hypothetical protein UZ15_CFX003002948 [Chloroflexi bacterium OLB15]|nr:MAG: hypothetical protein UZ15_CFX003002948 [Chloroflexi bacterium OLB15]
MRFIKSHWRALLISLTTFTAVFTLTAYLFLNGYLFGFMVDEQWISRDEFFDRAYHPENYDAPYLSCYNHWAGVYMVNHCFTDEADLIAFMESVDA